MKMKKLLLLLISVMIFGIKSFAQDNGQMIHGVIVDEKGLSIPGVNVTIKGTTTGTMSNMDGKFNLTAAKNSTIVLSSIGFITTEVAVNGRTNISITLKEDVQRLDEVVVTGYGEVRKRDLTGSTSQIQESQNVRQQYNTVDAMLQGRAAGVQVIGNDGAQGGATSVRIRGINSLRGNNEPLYVVDGVIISTAGEAMANPFGESGGSQSMEAQNGLTAINPRDIENIEILKDASATAIYGSRGANGVVLITTKKGEKGNDKISFYANTTFGHISKKMDVLDGYEYAMFINEHEIKTGQTPKYHIDPDTKIVYGVDPNTGLRRDDQVYESHNWQDEVYQMATSRNFGGSINGGSDGTRYYISMGIRDQNGVMSVSHNKGADFRANITRNLSKKLKFDIRSSLYYNQGSFGQTGMRGSGNNSVVVNSITANPLTTQVLDVDDLLNEDANSTRFTPVEQMSGSDDVTEEFRTNLSFNTEYKILKGLKAQLRAGTDIRFKDREIWYGDNTNMGIREQGVFRSSDLERKAFNVDFMLHYNKTFTGGHKLNGTLGTTYDGVNQETQVYGLNQFINLNFGVERPQLGESLKVPNAKNFSNTRMLSYLGRFNYTFKDKYILTATFRADGSSKFRGGEEIFLPGNSNKWGFFPSVSGAWYVSDEEFLKGNRILSNLKVRAGWGQVGNQAIPPYATWSNYNTSRYVDGHGNSVMNTKAANIANQNLTWETTEQTNVGLDFGFWDDRITLNADAYIKNTKNLLQNIQTPRSSGFSSYFVNRGEMINKGLELSLDAILVDKNDFKFSLGGNISFNRSYLGDLGVAPETFYLHGEEVTKQRVNGTNIATGWVLKAPANIFVEGEQFGLLYGYKTDGFYETAEEAANGPRFQSAGNVNQVGDPKFVDYNGDGIVNGEDKTNIGNPNPEFTYGINLSASYKGLSLKAMFNGVHNRDIMQSGNAFYGYASPTWGSNNILKSTYNNAWREPNSGATKPRVGYGDENGRHSFVSDLMIEDGSYLRLSTMTLSYNVPVQKVRFLQSLNVYATGRNLFVLTNYSGYDPEITSFLYDGMISGVDWLSFPNVRTYILGLNVTF